MNGRVVGAPRREGTESCGQTTVMEDGNLVGVVDGPACDQATCTTNRAASSEPASPQPMVDAGCVAVPWQEPTSLGLGERSRGTDGKMS